MYHVFLVEDENLIRQGIKKLIEWDENGFAFIGEAQDGEVAWPMIQKLKPDIVITDIRMPFMDGLELSKRIKKHMPQITVIILSGYDDFSYAKEAISIGIDQYVLKPLSKEKLVEVLHKVKEKKDADLKKVQYLGQTAVSFNFDELDVTKVDQRIVESFLMSGLHKELAVFVKEYFNTLGESCMENTIFRQYVALHIQFTVKAFLERISMCKEMTPIILEVAIPLSDAILSIDGTVNYVIQLLDKALTLRDQRVHNRNIGMMDKVIAYMKEHFGDQDMTLSTVAQVGNVSATYFSSVFSQQMGKTFVEYLTELRMNKARELLRCTDKSSGEIALEIGYKDGHYFSSLFKRINGCSPRDYRAGGNA